MSGELPLKQLHLGQLPWGQLILRTTTVYSGYKGHVDKGRYFIREILAGTDLFSFMPVIKVSHLYNRHIKGTV